MRKFIVLICLVSLLSCNGENKAPLELPSVIGSGMVLQRNSEVTIWGKNTPGKKVIISPEWGAAQTIRSEANGSWRTTLVTGEAGGPYSLTIESGDSTIVLDNILFGEVWLCSGQSNMEMPLMGWPPTDIVQNSAAEIKAADYPEIRMFTVARNVSPTLLTDCRGEWQECNPENAAAFSATAYFFGRELYKKLNVPIGLIHSSWGGTPAEAWTSREYLENIPAYTGITESLQNAITDYDSLKVWLEDLESYPVDASEKHFYSQFDYHPEVFASPDYNDSSWNKMTVPSLWEEKGLPQFDGIVWYRTSFTLPAGMKGKDLTVFLGPIDDMDKTYVNGVLIGEIMETGRWKEERVYTIPREVLKDGENVLAVCVADGGGGGGIYGTGTIRVTDNEGHSIPLNGEWSYMPIAKILMNKLYFYTEEKRFTDQPVMEMPINDHTPSVLYNAMIYPLVPYTIRGAIWYQGESNVGRGFEYRSLFPAMIECWRNSWNLGDFPFYYVQIAPWNYGEKERSQTAEVREAQLMTLSLPNTGMAVTMDIGDLVSIHPADKQDVGLRLALWALAKDYGYDSLEYSGPLYDTLIVSGDKAIVGFTHAEEGLKSDGNALTDFEIAGADQVYYPASATIAGEKVEVWSDRVKEPVAVRYGWSDVAEPNLFNAAGLPASPFRTDDWKRLSDY